MGRFADKSRILLGRQRIEVASLCIKVILASLLPAGILIVSFANIVADPAGPTATAQLVLWLTVLILITSVLVCIARYREAQSSYADYFLYVMIDRGLLAWLLSGELKNRSRTFRQSTSRNFYESLVFVLLNWHTVTYECNLGSTTRRSRQIDTWAINVGATILTVIPVVTILVSALISFNLVDLQRAEVFELVTGLLFITVLPSMALGLLAHYAIVTGFETAKRFRCTSELLAPAGVEQQGPPRQPAL